MPFLLLGLVWCLLSACIFSKKTEEKIIPTSAHVISPENSANGIRTSITLKWGFDSTVQASGYTFDVYVSRDTNALSPLANSIPEKEYTVQGLTPNTKYYWKIESILNGLKSSSPWFSFTTGSPPFVFLKPIAQWDFSGTGTKLLDMGPFGNHGSISGAKWSDSGLVFDGLDDYVTLDTCLKDSSGCWTSDEIVVEIEFTPDNIMFDSVQGLFYSGLYNNSMEVFLYHHSLFPGGNHEDSVFYAPALPLTPEKNGERVHFIMNMDMIVGSNSHYTNGKLSFSQTTRTKNVVAQPGETYILKPSIGAMNAFGTFTNSFLGTIHKLNIYKGIVIPLEVEEHFSILRSTL